MSADLHTDLTIELVMKNYPKMTPHMSKSLHWIKSYVDFSPKLIKLLLQMWLQTSVWELVQIRPRPAARKVEARLMRFRALWNTHVMLHANHHHYQCHDIIYSLVHN